MAANKWTWTNVNLNNAAERTPLPIVADSALATVGVAQGRLIPVLIVDTSSRPDIEDLIKAHKDLPPGDVDSTWGKTDEKENAIHLVLMFKNPVRTNAVFEFDIPTNGFLVEQIVVGGGLYLQSGIKGDKLSSTLDHQRIFIQVPSGQFKEEWDLMWHKTLEHDARKNQGMGRHEAKRFSKEVIEKWRKFGRAKLVRE